jgi:hypothetical protein
LYLSNYFEHSSLPEYITIFSGMAFIASLRLIVYRYDLRYPKFLGGQETSH